MWCAWLGRDIATDDGVDIDFCDEHCVLCKGVGEGGDLVSN